MADDFNDDVNEYVNDGMNDDINECENNDVINDGENERVRENNVPNIPRDEVEMERPRLEGVRGSLHKPTDSHPVIIRNSKGGANLRGGVMRSVNKRIEIKLSIVIIDRSVSVHASVN